MELLPKGMKGKLILAGDFIPPTLLDQVSSRPGWARVEQLGFISRPAASQLLRQARAGLLLFHPEPNHVHSQPNKLFEYMSAGLPVIASDFPLWREIIEGVGCGLLVDPLNPEAISQAIGHLLTNLQDAESMGQRGLEAVRQKYNWVPEEKKLLALYEEVLAED
jgi:glycosyltransferase involved in cell wall biosynthesis